MAPPIIDLEGVGRRFVKSLDLAGRIARALGADLRDEIVHAVDDVSLAIQPGEVVGLVGESGCGKSTLGRMVAGILPPSKGTIRFKGRERPGLEGADAKAAALAVQMIFQDPMSSLNPRKRVRDIIGEAPRVHGLVSAAELDDFLDEIMINVGLDPSYKRRYPHQFSGGQRARIGIARALSVRPEFLVCDESVAALDVSIQAQVLNLFMDLRRRLDLTYLFISHDLGVIEHISDRVVIMYLGRVVEAAPAEALFAGAEPSLHPRPARGGAADRRPQAPLRADQGRDPLAARSAARLPFPPALPVRDGALQGRAAGAEGDRARAHLGLSSQ